MSTGTDATPGAESHPLRTGMEQAVIPAAWLRDLACRIRLTRGEWRLLAIYLSTPRPISVRQAARALRLSYPFAKRLTRGLVAWRLLCRRAPGVLTFNPRADEWGPPEAPR